jgi:hypothetical protein
LAAGFGAPGTAPPYLAQYGGGKIDYDDDYDND